MQKADRDGDEPLLILTDAPDAPAKAAIGEGLAAFNEERAGYWDRRALAVLAHAADGKAVVGGLLGRTALGLLFIDVFFLPETLRGRGIGSRIVRLAEEEGYGAAAGPPCSTRSASRRRDSTSVSATGSSAASHAIRPAPRESS
jgi:GNAT superfamily N-acetyltransferase